MKSFLLVMRVERDILADKSSAEQVRDTRKEILFLSQQSKRHDNDYHSNDDDNHNTLSLEVEKKDSSFCFVLLLACSSEETFFFFEARRVLLRDSDETDFGVYNVSLLWSYLLSLFV